MQRSFLLFPGFPANPPLLITVFFLIPAPSPEGDVGGVGRGVAFTPVFAVVIVVGEVKCIPYDEQDYWQDGVACKVEAGEVEQAVLGRIGLQVIYRDNTAGLHFMINGSQGVYQGVSCHELNLAGIE